MHSFTPHTHTYLAYLTSFASRGLWTRLFLNSIIPRSSSHDWVAVSAPLWVGDAVSPEDIYQALFFLKLVWRPLKTIKDQLKTVLVGLHPRTIRQRKWAFLSPRRTGGSFQDMNLPNADNESWCYPIYCWETRGILDTTWLTFVACKFRSGIIAIFRKCSFSVNPHSLLVKSSSVCHKTHMSVDFPI